MGRRDQAQIPSTRRARRRRSLLARAISAPICLAVFLASAGLASAAQCTDSSATAEPFATVGPENGTWVENMGFDGKGGMWVSELLGNSLVRFDAKGQPGSSLSLPSPGASLLGPDDRFYALYGDSTTATVPGPPMAGVVSFNPSVKNPVSKPFADGIPMANGAAFDGRGNLYVADTVSSGAGLIKLRPDGSRAPRFTADVPVSGADGIAIIGDRLFVTLFSDTESSIVEVPLKHPKAYRTLVKLSPSGEAPKYPDDLAVGPDGELWVATNVGELLRVNPKNGHFCTVYSRTAPIDSVRFPVAFPPFRGTSDAFLSSENGEITHLHFKLKRPSIHLKVMPKHLSVHHRRTLHVRVRASTPACIDKVRVRFGHSRSRTDASGRARLHVRPKATGRRLVHARKSGCVAAKTRVRVSRHR